MTSYTSNMNPMAKVATGAGMFSDLIHPKKDGPDNKPAPAQNPPLPPQQPVPAASKDPAYSEVQKDMPYLNILHVLLTSGKNGGINWDEASGSSTAGAASRSADYIHQMLQDADNAFAGLASPDGQPSKDLKSIMTTCVEISATVVSEAKKGTTMSNKFPQADSTEVKDWQQRFQASYAQAQTMVAVAKALPGGSAAGVYPIMITAKFRQRVLILMARYR